jgi:hypothetical protein
VVDEVGPLELRGAGLERGDGKVPARARTGGRMRVLLVVREGPVQRVREHYGLGEGETVAVSVGDLAGFTLVG